MPADLDVTSALPYLKPAVADGIPALAPGPDDALVGRPFIGRLFIFYLVERGDHFQYVQRRHLAAAGVTEDGLYRQAVRNLAARAATGQVRTAPHGSITAVFFDGNLESR